MNCACVKNDLTCPPHTWVSGEMGDSERICITQFEQKEYDSFAYENEDIPGENTHTHKTCILLLYVYNTGSCKNRLLWIWYLEQMMSWIQCCCAGSFLLAIIHIGILCRPSKIGHHSSGQHVSFVILLLYHHILVLISLFRWPRVHGGYPAGRGRHRRGSLPTEDIPGNQCFGSVFYWIRIRILAIF